MYISAQVDLDNYPNSYFQYVVSHTMFRLKRVKFSPTVTGLSIHPNLPNGVSTNPNQIGMYFIIPLVQSMSACQVEALNKCHTLMGCYGQIDLNPRKKELKYLTGIEYVTNGNKTKVVLHVFHAKPNAEVSAIQDAYSRTNFKNGSIVEVEVSNPFDKVSKLPELIPKLYMLNKRDFFVKEGWTVLSELNDSLRMQRIV